MIHISFRVILSSEELPFDIREEGLKTFYYIVGASTSLGRKVRKLHQTCLDLGDLIDLAQDFALEHEDCRVIQNDAQYVILGAFHPNRFDIEY